MRSLTAFTRLFRGKPAVSEEARPSVSQNQERPSVSHAEGQYTAMLTFTPYRSGPWGSLYPDGPRDSSDLAKVALTVSDSSNTYYLASLPFEGEAPERLEFQYGRDSRKLVYENGGFSVPLREVFEAHHSFVQSLPRSAPSPFHVDGWERHNQAPFGVVMVPRPGAAPRFMLGATNRDRIELAYRRAEPTGAGPNEAKSPVQGDWLAYVEYT